MNNDMKEHLGSIEDVLEAIIGVEQYFDQLLEADRIKRGGTE